MLDGCARYFSKGKAFMIICLFAFLANMVFFSHYNATFKRGFKPSIALSREYTNNKANSLLAILSSDNLRTEHDVVLSSLCRILANVTGEAENNVLVLPLLSEAIKALKDNPNITALVETMTRPPSKGYKVPNGIKLEAPTVEKERTLKPVCPETLPGLVGRRRSNQTTVLPSQLESRYPQLEKGGHYAPEDCTPSQKLAIVIPYRNRFSHLHILLNNLLPFLMRQQLDFRIFVIDQDLPTVFNRGMLFNVGYLEALKVDNFDCFIFHDVDMIPLDDHCLYRCSNSTPRHMTTGISKWKYNLPYGGYYGGVVAITREQFQEINGDSNLYFGWGGEDDDLRIRVTKKGYSVIRYPVQIGIYDTISHTRDTGNTPNPDRSRLVWQAAKRQDIEGLNTTKYRVTQIQEKHLYTWINVFINMTEVLQTTPPEMMNMVLALRKISQKFQ